jgi:iron(II)-dependent oxidoreductase
MIFILVLTAGCRQTSGSLTPPPPTETLRQLTSSPTLPPILATESSILPTKTPAPTVEEVSLAELDTLPGETCLAAGLPEQACQGVSANAAWTPVMREFNGIQTVLVPAGCFQMGYEDNLPEERPVHRICFEHPFWIDRTETTVAQFAQFLNGQNHLTGSLDNWLDVQAEIGEEQIQLKLQNGIWKPLRGFANQPIKNATWIGADAYCTWRGARLPTEAEWEYAARGPESWYYPWGNEYVSTNLLRSGVQIADVGSLPQGASWVGALDMSGSLYEWTHSLYWPYPYDPNDGREASLEEDDGDRVFRGCPWYHSEDNIFGPRIDNVSATARHDNPPDTGLWYFGFRCAQSFNP